jgi:hypothetical protein
MTDNLRIWSQVDKTDPAHTKKVNQRGGFTAISAAYQIMRATEVFGPVGEGWGYTALEPIFHDSLVLVPVTLWHGNRANSFGPMLGCAEWKTGRRLDSDAAKKATTDALTKLLSQLGFNADVFLGRFDDSKYVAEMEREFASGPAAQLAKITPEQVSEIQALIVSVGADVPKFLDYLKVSSVEAIPATSFNAAKAALEAKRKKESA